MYPNLDRELGANKMSWRSAAKAIRMPESTFRDKIIKGGFSVTEAFKIQKILLPKYTLEYLFEPDSKNKETKTA